jgi:membrane fusion protein, multidrug efflux system
MQESPTMSDEAKPSTRTRTLIVAGTALAVAAIGGAWLLSAPGSESTDDAYTAADITTIAPRVRGFVAEVLVSENQTVHAGQPLLRIDDEEFAARLASAQADLAAAEAAQARAEAGLATLDAQQRQAVAEREAAATAIRSADANARVSGADAHRYQALLPAGSVARSEADRADAAAVAAEQDRARAGANLAVATQAVAVVQSKHGDQQAAIAAARAQVAQARAALDLARQDAGHTRVIAPVDGVIGNRQARVGDYVQAGTRLMSLVPVAQTYVVAYFKENQTGRIRPGQSARISVDALGSTHLTGHVESIAPGSGSTFALLPFEPGTGNFTKIVQRVPVRIRLDSGQQALARLRPGLSVTATVTL